MTNGHSKPFIAITPDESRKPFPKKDLFYWRRLHHIICNFEDFVDRILQGSTQYSSMNKADIKRRCEELLKAATKKGDIGEVKVMYTPPATHIGRVYTRSTSLQNLVRCIRHTITVGLYIDIDIKNAMPTIIAQYARNNGLEMPVLQRYVTDRKRMLDELTEVSGLTFEEGKAAAHAILNNGFGPLSRRHDAPAWVTYLIAEVATLAQHIQRKEIDIWRLAEEKAKKNTTLGLHANAIGSAVSMLYGHLEHQCLMCMHDKLKELKLTGRGGMTISLIFDGCMIPKPADGYDTQKLLRQLENAINEGTGYKVELDIKPLDQGFKDIPDDEDLQEAMEVESEEDEVDIMEEMGWKDTALGHILTHFTHANVAKYYASLKGGMKYCSFAKKWYIIDDPAKSCIWVECDNALGLEEDIPNTITEVLKAEARKIIEWCGDNPPDGLLKKVASDIDAKWLNHIGNMNFIQNTISKLRSLPGVRHERFADILDIDPWVLPFSDKLVNLKTMNVREIVPEDYIMKHIGYPYPTQSNPEIRENIKSILRGMQTDEANYNYLMSVLSACLPGCNMFQEIYIFWGPGGNGKSLVGHALAGALGGYANGLMAKIRSQTMVRAARAANDHDDWAKTKGCRAYWCPEVRKSDVMQEDVIRQQTGGEEIVARDCGGKTTTFKATATPICGFNDMPRLPTDQSMLRRIHVVPFPYLFVHQERLDEEPNNQMLRLRVNEYEEWFKSHPYHVEFMRMMLTHWEMHVLGRSSLPQTREARDATHNALFGGDRFKEFLVTKCVVDDDPKVFIPAAKLLNLYNEHLEAAGLSTTSHITLAALMKSRGYDSKRKKCGSVYPGIRGLTPSEIKEREDEERRVEEEYQDMLEEVENRGVKRKHKSIFE